MSEALLFAENGENMLCTKIVLNVGKNFCSQHVLPRFELEIFMYWTCNSINNLSSYCGFVDAKKRAFDKELPVHLRYAHEKDSIFYWNSALSTPESISFVSPLKCVQVMILCKFFPITSESQKTLPRTVKSKVFYNSSISFISGKSVVITIEINLISKGILWRGIFQFGKKWKYFKIFPMICLCKLQWFLLV